MKAKPTDLLMTVYFLVTEGYSGKGKDPFWSAVKADHIICITYPLVRQGSNSRGYRAAGLELENKSTGQTGYCTNNMLLQYLSKVKYITLPQVLDMNPKS